MNASRVWELIRWPVYGLVLLAVMWWEYGLRSGLAVFAGLIYCGSCALIVIELAAALLARATPSKARLLGGGAVVIVYGGVQTVLGNFETVWLMGMLGVWVGLVLGLAVCYGGKVLKAESSFYARVADWIRSKRS